jgi:uncharacterized membrane protein
METISVKTAITLICLGLALIAVGIPLYFGKIKMNRVYGFRIGKAFESEKNWLKINRYGAKAIMWWSIVLMVLGICCLFIDPQYALTIAKVGFISLVIPIILTLNYAKRL